MLNMKRLAAIGAVALLLVLLCKGCVFARRGGADMRAREEARGGVEKDTAQGEMIAVYLREEKTMVWMALEAYLTGVVAAEMPASFAEEALKAQAVAARTYTLRRKAQGGCEAGADVCTSSACCQAYASDTAQRKNWGGGYATNKKKIAQAVAATAGEAVFYEGALIDALYHAASGGQTEDSENVFASAQPYLRGVVSAEETGSSHITGEKTFTAKAFAKAVNAAFPQAKLKAGALGEQVEIIERFASGRAQTVRINKMEVSGRELRKALGLESAWFELRFSKDRVTVTTRGFGHGVGMSQAGANGMAQQGASYREILAHYYTGTVVH